MLSMGLIIPGASRSSTKSVAKVSHSQRRQIRTGAIEGERKEQIGKCNWIRGILNQPFGDLKIAHSGSGPTR